MSQFLHLADKALYVTTLNNYVLNIFYENNFEVFLDNNEVRENSYAISPLYVFVI